MLCKIYFWISATVLYPCRHVQHRTIPVSIFNAVLEHHCPNTFGLLQFVLLHFGDLLFCSFNILNFYNMLCSMYDVWIRILCIERQIHCAQCT